MGPSFGFRELRPTSPVLRRIRVDAKLGQRRRVVGRGATTALRALGFVGRFRLGLARQRAPAQAPGGAKRLAYPPIPDPEVPIRPERHIETSIGTIRGVAHDAPGGYGGHVIHPPPTTKILAIGTINPGFEQSQVFAALPEAVRETVDLYLDGKIEQWYSLQGKQGVAFIINVTDPAVAHEMLEKLPLHALQKAKRVERANGDQFEAHHMCFTKVDPDELLVDERFVAVVLEE